MTAIDLLPFQAAMIVVAVHQAEFRPFLNALREVETGGEPHGGRDAIGDGGRSLGPYQIGRAYWQDSRVPGKWQDVRHRDYAERVMVAYWARHCPWALTCRNFETLARVHNGGPAGHRKQATLAYWKKVQKAMKKGGKP